MKNYYFPILALLFFTACENTASNSSSVSNSENSQVVEANAAAQPTDDSHTEQTVAQRVMSIYDFNRPNKGGSCCSKHWEYLVSAVDAKVCDGECDGYYGYFEYDYWIMGQDYVDDIHISDVKVEKLEGDFAEVSFVLHNFEPIQMAVELVYENNDWYIDNIINKSQNLNLKNDMESFLKK